MWRRRTCRSVVKCSLKVAQEDQYSTCHRSVNHVLVPFDRASHSVAQSSSNIDHHDEPCDRCGCGARINARRPYGFDAASILNTVIKHRTISMHRQRHQRQRIAVQRGYNDKYVATLSHSHFKIESGSVRRECRAWTSVQTIRRR